MNWPRTSRGLPLGGAAELNLEEATAHGKAWLASTHEARAQAQQPAPVQAARTVYAAPTGATTLAPSGPEAGVPLPYGRVWAEARSVTASAGPSVEVALVSAQNGVRCTITANEGATITGGTVRFWTFDPASQRWSLGGVEETLPTGVRSVNTTDQFITVGAQ